MVVKSAGFIDAENKGQPNGFAGLGSDGLVPMELNKPLTEEELALRETDYLLSRSMKLKGRSHES